MSVAAPRAWKEVSRTKTAGDLLGKVDGCVANDEDLSIPSTPKLELTRKPAGEWTVAKPKEKLASQPESGPTDLLVPDSLPADCPQSESIPLSLDMLLSAEKMPDLAMMPEASKPKMDIPINLPTELPDLDVPKNTDVESDKQTEQPVKQLIKNPAKELLEKPTTKREQDRPAKIEPEKIIPPEWPVPVALFEQLEKLQAKTATKTWAAETSRQIEALCMSLSMQSGGNESRILDAFTRLRSLNDQADRATDQMKDDDLAEMLRRTSSALRRRLNLWQLIVGMDSPGTNGDESYLDSDRLAMVLLNVETLMGNSSQGAAWREFLLLDALKSLAHENKASGTDSVDSNWNSKGQRRMLAGEVLARVARSKLSENQQEFLSHGPFVELGTELRRINDSAFDQHELVRRLEEYEAHNLPGEARWLADESLRLAVSRDARKKALGQQLAKHYCNPNMRIALTEELLNRLMPEQTAELAPVRDTVLGTPVRGQSLTETDVAIHLIPDPHRLLLALEISGDVASLTNSRGGPAIFRTESTSRYIARKPMEITTAGITLWPAEVTGVSNDTRLRSLRTDYDDIPLLGAIVQGMARSSHDSKRQEVKREIKQKIATSAKQRIDSEADSRLNQTSQRLKNRIIEPLQNLSIVPEMIASETNEQRLVMQLRLASAQQLAAHTQRPWAPMDSLFSMQVHQTAVNNILGGLKLDGRTLTLKELREHVAEKFNAPALLENKTKHDDVLISFAVRDSASIDCRDGRVAVTLSIARLEKSPHIWKNFQVRAYYRVELDGLSATLDRDGSIRLVGRRISTRSQIAIRSIFGRVFSKNASRQIIPDRIRENPKMSDQVVTQFDIEDGWIAFAMGPRR
ncbi:MAG: hypothetical protein JXM70_26610 [Pirellulales bacterium]|nr:hypothetical protein [Pirellulales bacterium]